MKHYKITSVGFDLQVIDTFCTMQCFFGWCKDGCPLEQICMDCGKYERTDDKIAKLLELGIIEEVEGEYNA